MNNLTADLFPACIIFKGRGNFIRSSVPAKYEQNLYTPSLREDLVSPYLPECLQF